MRRSHLQHYPDGASVSASLHYGVRIDGPEYDRLGNHFGFFGRRVEELRELEEALEGGLAAASDGRTAIIDVHVTR
jgi:thiamine pyrophosphate-dependent acetolactate synthase large subunit-like protein